jgi:hypothetical protein
VLSTLRSKLSYANVMATVAVFVALGGTSVAAISLTRNSVRSKHIAKGQVKRSDIGLNAVNSRKVANHSLRLVDFRAGQIPGGPPGAPGAPGSPGSPAASMLMGHIPSALTTESGSTAYPPIGVAAAAGGSMTSPNTTVVLRDLFVRAISPPGPGATRTGYIGVGGMFLPPEPALSCAITGAATTCDSGDATLSVPPGSRLIFALSSSVTDPAESAVEFGYRATTP